MSYLRFSKSAYITVSGAFECQAHLSACRDGPHCAVKVYQELQMVIKGMDHHAGDFTVGVTLRRDVLKESTHSEDVRAK
jgi:ferritin-like protein